jgi:hypothetical protein
VEGVPSLRQVIQLIEGETAGSNSLARLRASLNLVRELEEIGDATLGYFVDQARHAGHSWSDIGNALGVSKQAAQQKHTVPTPPDLMAPTFAPFTPRALNVVKAAEDIARKWGHSYIGTEHLLLALYEEPDGIAAQILVESKLPADRATAAVQLLVVEGSGAPEGKLPLTPKAKSAFSGALAASSDMGHSYIGTEHLLMGLHRQEGMARDVLSQAGLTSEVLRRRVQAKLARHVRTGEASAKGARTTRTKKAPREPKA